MKKIVFVLSFVLMFGSTIIANPNKNESNNANASTRIAFLGLDYENFRSNYFSNDLIAEKLKVKEDSINMAFNGGFFKALNSVCQKKKKYEVIYCCQNNNKELLDKVQYQEHEDEMISDLTKVPQEQFGNILNDMQAEMVLLIDQYYIKKEGYPYNNFSHIINYSVYDKNKSRIYQGRYQFTSLDLDHMDEYGKQFSKAANKLLAKIDN